MTLETQLIIIAKRLFILLFLTKALIITTSFIPSKRGDDQVNRSLNKASRGTSGLYQDKLSKRMARLLNPFKENKV
jgi:hypothetical protein